MTEKTQAVVMKNKNTKPAAKKKNKGGRPSTYRSEYCELLIDLMSEGYSIEACAGKIGVAAKTIHQWAHKHQEFGHAKKIGEAMSQLFWERMGIQGAQGMIKGFNPAVWIFNMKNRFKWRDKIDIDQSINLEPIVIETDNRTITMEMGEAKNGEFLS